MITLASKFHFFTLFVCKAPYANCLFLSAPAVWLFFYTAAENVLNAELPQSVVQMLKPMFVHCLIKPEDSELLIRPPPTQKQCYKQEKMQRYIHFFYFHYGNNNTLQTHNNKTFPDCEFQHRTLWNQSVLHEQHLSFVLVIIFDIYLLNNQKKPSFSEVFTTIMIL